MLWQATIMLWQKALIRVGFLSLTLFDGLAWVAFHSPKFAGYLASLREKGDNQSGTGSMEEMYILIIDEESNRTSLYI